VIRFLAPSFLYALALLAIPIIIHLFNFRRFKKVLFTNVKFLQELKEETTRVSKLKHLLVLAARLLAVLFLVLAFAQPIIPVTNATTKSTSRQVSIYIDNSFSMEGVTKEGTLLEVAKKKAREVVNAFPASAKFQLLTNDFEAVHQRIVTKEEFIEELDRVSISPVSRNISKVVERQKEAFPNGEKAFFLISDFQATTSDIQVIKNDTLVELNVISLPVQPSSNVYIDSCWLNSPVVQLNRPVEINVKLTNSGAIDKENVPVRLVINGTQRAVASTPIKAGESVTLPINFTVTTPSWQKLEVQITDEPITFDDSYFISFEVKEFLNILSIDGRQSGPYLKALFGQDPFFKFNQVAMNKVDYSSLGFQNLIVLNELPSISSGLSTELNKYVAGGGSLIWFPDSAADLNSYNMFASQIGIDSWLSISNNSDKVERVDVSNPVFSDVFESKKLDGRIDYPTALKHFVVGSGSNTNRQVLMQLQNGHAFLSQYSIVKGSLYVFSVPLSPGFSNIARHAIVVPLLYKMALLSMKSPAMMEVLGNNAPIVLDKNAIGADETYHLKNSELKVDIIPMHRVLPNGVQINVGDKIPSSGHFDLSSGNTISAVLSYNYDRKESDLQFLDEAAITEKSTAARITNLRYFKGGTADLTKRINQLAEGISLWKYCLLAVLFFLLIETLLLRFWKKA
jgi:hypothetical protein